jgi:hypothetical protein
MYLNTYFYFVSGEEKGQMKTATLSGGRPVWLPLTDMLCYLNIAQLEMEMGLFSPALATYNFKHVSR